MHIRRVSQRAQAAISNTKDCEAICVQTVQYCLEVGGDHAAPTHNKLLLDCADICAATARILLRGSHQQVMEACATLCDLCAASCEKFAGDPQMKACANQCLLCASACRQAMSAATGYQGLRDEDRQGGSHQGVGAQGSTVQGAR
jgi:hypothetical protein